MSDKPLPPTSKRLRDARAEGNVARSEFLTGFIAAFLATEAVFALVDACVDRWLALEASLFARVAQADRLDACLRLIASYAASIVAMVGLVALIAVIAAAFSAWTCGGLSVAPKAIKPSFKRLDAARHIKALASTKNLAATALALTSAAIVGITAYLLLRERLALVDAMVEWQSIAFDFSAGIATLHGFVRSLFAALCIPALLSIVIARRQHRRTLRMTHRELKDEQKQTTGNPSMRARQRASFAEASLEVLPAGRGSSKRALVMNPEHVAVLLDYDGDESEPPIVVAKATDDDALRMMNDALLDRVAVFRFRRLARHLYRHGELEADIPADCYRAVAIVYRIVDEIEAISERPNTPIDIDDIAFDS
jgi:flagellar biosynthesis protein FlhB